MLQQNFLIMKVNYSRENQNRQFLSQLPPIPGYPYFFLLESDGRYLQTLRNGDFISRGQYDEARFLSVLESVAPAG